MQDSKFTNDAKLIMAFWFRREEVLWVFLVLCYLSLDGCWESKKAWACSLMSSYPLSCSFAWTVRAFIGLISCFSWRFIFSHRHWPYLLSSRFPFLSESTLLTSAAPQLFSSWTPRSVVFYWYFPQSLPFASISPSPAWHSQGSFSPRSWSLALKIWYFCIIRWPVFFPSRVADNFRILPNDPWFKYFSFQVILLPPRLSWWALLGTCCISWWNLYDPHRTTCLFLCWSSRSWYWCCRFLS